jgi:hypothetical protein
MPKGISSWNMRNGDTLSKRMDTYTDKSAGPDGCWIWTGTLNGRGYGRVMWSNKAFLAHRKAWEETNGPIGAGLFVCHHCDVKKCVNPKHLFLGTAKDNTHDMKEKGRGIEGETVASSKLVEAEVHLIRVDPRPYKEIEEDFGVSQPTISQIKNYKTWKHL